MGAMARIAPLSGFPELLPADRWVETAVLDHVRHVFELHGFAGIETRAVEPIERLLSKGETSKEVYLLRRLQAAGESEEASLGLHFDLTVPLARYVLENAGRLTFPFKRYQIQKVWRGERPQDGRYREFTQADIDVVGAETLPFHYEVELPLVMAEALSGLQRFAVPPVRVLVNNRKVSQGFYEGLGIDDVDGVLRAIDKLDKIGPERVADLLQNEVGLTAEQARSCLELADISGDDVGVADRVRALGVTSPLLTEGLAELTELLAAAQRRMPAVVRADLRIARGLDYYTGTVYETVLQGHEDLGSICSGGRYDSLASDGKNTYPGVGLSIGVTRLLSRVLGTHLAQASRPVPTAVLVAVTDEEHRGASTTVADTLRSRGIPTDVAPTAAKFGKQIKFADRRGIPFVWFTTADGYEVKDIRSGEQVPADPQTWNPPEADLWPRVVRPQA